MLYALCVHHGAPSGIYLVEIARYQNVHQHTADRRGLGRRAYYIAAPYAKSFISATSSAGTLSNPHFTMHYDRKVLGVMLGLVLGLVLGNIVLPAEL